MVKNSLYIDLLYNSLFSYRYFQMKNKRNNIFLKKKYQFKLILEQICSAFTSPKKKNSMITYSHYK